MLDKLKDIVPDVNENKAKFIYEKGLARKAKFTFNYKLALRLVCLLIVLIPVVVFIGLGSNKFGNLNEDINMGGESMEPKPGGDDLIQEPGSNEEADVLEYFRYTLDKNTGILELYFYDYYDIYYIKEYSGYEIKSVSVDGVLIEGNEGVYAVNLLDRVQIQFNGDINNKIEIYVSTNNEHFIGYCIYVK